MTFGENLKNFRHAKKISQTKLSEKTGFPQTTISDWENNKYFPDIIEAQKIAAVLGIKISRLLNDKDCFSKNEAA
jgi:transcriptional regulator with XRE-family HTH domain